MCKTLCGTLLLLAVFVLFLNFSHATAEGTVGSMGNVKRNFMEDSRLKDVYDTFRILYNQYKHDTHLSNIKNQSFTMNIWISGEIEVVATTCEKIESDFRKCFLQREFYRIKRTPKGTTYYVSLPGRVRCKKFLSNLAKCSFEEQTEEQKREICYFQVYSDYTEQKTNSVYFDCYTD